MSNNDYIEYDYSALIKHSKLGLIEVYALLNDHGVYDDYTENGVEYREFLEDPEFSLPYYIDEDADTVTYIEKGSDDLKRAYSALSEAYWNSME